MEIANVLWESQEMITINGQNEIYFQSIMYNFLDNDTYD